MVDVMGHFAFALLLALPAWALWDGRVSLAFVAFALSTAMLPDVDLVLQAFLPVQHHGVTHTVVFVTGVSLVAGVLAEYGLKSWLERLWLERRGYTVAPGMLFLFAFAGMVAGGYSHLVADMLSAPDIAAPVEPFWPLFEKPWSVDVLWYNSQWWNAGLLAVALAAHAVAVTVDRSVGHPWHLGAEE